MGEPTRYDENAVRRGSVAQILERALARYRPEDFVTLEAEHGLDGARDMVRRNDLALIVLTALDVARTDADEALEAAAAEIPEAAVAGLGHVQLFLLILTWLTAVGLPAVRAELPRASQVLAGDETGTVALALVLTDKMRQQD